MPDETSVRTQWLRNDAAGTNPCRPSKPNNTLLSRLSSCTEASPTLAIHMKITPIPKTNEHIDQVRATIAKKTTYIFMLLSGSYRIIRLHDHRAVPQTQPPTRLARTPPADNIHEVMRQKLVQGSDKPCVRVHLDREEMAVKGFMTNWTEEMVDQGVDSCSGLRSVPGLIA